MAGIKVTIGGSVAGLKAALNQAESQVQKFGKKVKTFFGGFGGMLAGAGIGFGLKKMIDDLDNLGKRASGLGMTAEEMQKIEYAAQSSNVAVEQLGSVLPRMMDTVAEAAGGSQKAVDALAKLGLTAEQLKDKRPYEVFTTLVEAVRAIPDPMQRVSAAMDIFGKGLAKNMNFFDEFAENVKALENSGRMLSDEDVNAAKEINQNLTDAAAAIRAIVVDTGVLRGLVEVISRYRAAFGEGKLREQTGVEQTWYSRALDVAENVEKLYNPFSWFTGGGVRAARDLVTDATGGSMVENYAEALQLTPSTTAKTPAQLAEEERQRNENIDKALEDFFGDLSEAVDEVAEKTTASKTPRSLMRGEDPTFTDALRRIGGDAGGVYRQGDNYARTTAEATKAMAENIDNMTRNGINLRG